MISHDFNRACSCLRASLEVSSSKTRKASRTRHIGPVVRSVSGSCSTQRQRSAEVSKGAGGAGCSTLPSAESGEPSCSALLVDTCAAPAGADAGCAAPLSGPHCADCDIGGCAEGSPGWRAVCHGLRRSKKGCGTVRSRCTQPGVWTRPRLHSSKESVATNEALNARTTHMEICLFVTLHSR